MGSAQLVCFGLSECFLLLILLPLRHPQCCLFHFQVFYTTVALGIFLYDLHLISGNAETNGVSKQPGWETPLLLHFRYMQLGRLSHPATSAGHDKRSINAWHGGSAVLEYTPQFLHRNEKILCFSVHQFKYV